MDLAARLLLTYVLHSTVLLGAAWAACRVLGERRLALQEALVRAALAGGFATASLQVAFGVVPLGGSLRLPTASAAVVSPGSASDAGPGLPPAAIAREAASTRLVAPEAGTAPAASWPMRIVIVPAEPTWAERALGALRRAAAGGWREALVLAWAAVATAALARLAVAARRLERLLRGRTPLASSPLSPVTDALGVALGLRAPVPISTAPRLSVPLATGVLRPEVCLPTRAVVDLGAEEQAALCAHELAHVARRDPAWVLAARLAESVAPLQPLNGWARRRLQDLAECLSDDLAVSVSARPIGLARSLVDVASWTLDDPALIPAAASGALTARSRLSLRVERLMDPIRRPERPRRLLLPVAAVAVLATALVTPVVSGSAGEPAAPPKPKEAEARLEELSRQIAERARLHEADVKKLEAEVQAAMSRMQPSQAEMGRLSAEMSRSAAELAALLAARPSGGRARVDDEATREIARRVALLQQELRRGAREIRVPAEEQRALAETARAIAEAARPSEAELAEIRRLSEQLARESMADAKELAEMARARSALARDHARLVSEKSREAMRRAADEVRRAMDEMRRAMDQVRQERQEQAMPAPEEPSPLPARRPEPQPQPEPQQQAPRP